MGTAAKTGNAPKASNLDATGRRIVSRGCVVSWFGYRLRVTRVRMGLVYGQALGLDGKPVPAVEFARSYVRASSCVVVA